METQSAAPSNPTDDKLQNPASVIVQPTVEDQNDTKTGANGGISSTSMFVNSEPMREEQVQNMDPPQKVSNAQPAGTNQDGPVTSSSNVQPQVSTQIMQPSSAAPAGVISTLTQSRFHWFYALLAVVVIFALSGLAVRFLALSSAGTAVLAKIAAVPRLKSWIRKVVFEEKEGSAKKLDSMPSLEQEAAAAKAAAAAAAADVADVARASQEMLLSKSAEEKYFKGLMNLIGMQVQEMKSTRCSGRQWYELMAEHKRDTRRTRGLVKKRHAIRLKKNAANILLILSHLFCTITEGLDSWYL